MSTTNTTTVTNLSQVFRSLHKVGQPLLVGNAWDAASALLLERAGFPAIATTSGAVAWASGRPDGNAILKDDLYRTVEQIRAVTTIPLSVDVEGGLTRSAAGAAQLVVGLSERGVQGINFEDSWAGVLDNADAHARRISAIRAAVEDMFVNARVDTFFLSTEPDETRVRDAVSRGNAYLRAGADGVFVPGVIDLELISQLVQGIDGPVNVMAGASASSNEDLARVGVARISWGTAIAEAAYDRADEVSRSLLGQASSSRAVIDYAQLNEALALRSATDSAVTGFASGSRAARGGE